MARTRTGIALVFVFGLLPTCFGLQQAVRAQRNSAGSERSSDTKAQPSPGTPGSTAADASKSVLDHFAWLEGRWRGEWGPRVAEQSWLGPKAGEMLGVFRLAEGDRTLVIELFTLVEKSDSTVLNLGEFDANKFDFENPRDGMPKRSILTRIDADTFTSRSEIVPDSGDMQVIEITYHREKPAPEKPSVGSAGRRKTP